MLVDALHARTRGTKAIIVANIVTAIKVELCYLVSTQARCIEAGSATMVAYVLVFVRVRVVLRIHALGLDLVTLERNHIRPLWIWFVVKPLPAPHSPQLLLNTPTYIVVPGTTELGLDGIEQPRHFVPALENSNGPNFRRGPAFIRRFAALPNCASLQGMLPLRLTPVAICKTCQQLGKIFICLW